VLSCGVVPTADGEEGVGTHEYLRCSGSPAAVRVREQSAPKKPGKHLQVPCLHIPLPLHPPTQ